MKSFRKVSESPKTEETPVKRGRPVGAKNKGKAVTATKAKGSPYTGTYGRISGITHVELLDGVKYRIFDSGNVGTVNVRLKLHFANGESAIIGPASMTFLEDRDDAWRKANGKTNNRSALHVSELTDWSHSASAKLKRVKNRPLYSPTTTTKINNSMERWRKPPFYQL